VVVRGYQPMRVLRITRGAPPEYPGVEDVLEVEVADGDAPPEG